jgi:hypothetical protein
MVDRAASKRQRTGAFAIFKSRRLIITLTYQLEHEVCTPPRGHSCDGPRGHREWRPCVGSRTVGILWSLDVGRRWQAIPSCLCRHSPLRGRNEGCGPQRYEQTRPRGTAGCSDLYTFNSTSCNLRRGVCQAVALLHPPYFAQIMRIRLQQLPRQIVSSRRCTADALVAGHLERQDGHRPANGPE